MNIDELERLAREAADEGEGDWFDSDLIESKTPILSTRKARRYIAAASPDVMVKLIAVVRAAQTVETTSGTSITALCVLSVALAALKGAP
jgi:hypothetical protein